MGKPISAWKILLPVVVITALAAGAGVWVMRKGQAPEPGKIAVGSQVPRFELPTLEGKSVSSAEVGAKVVMINFWASWCAGCITEMPSIIALRRAYQSQGFEVISINVDEEPEKQVPRMVKKLGIDFPTYVDRDQALAELFDVEVLPLTVILDKNRKVLLMETGERDWNGTEIRSQLERWLAS